MFLICSKLLNEGLPNYLPNLIVYRPPTLAPTNLFNHACQDIYGGGWSLVRHSYNGWHDETDNLAGTDIYGTYDADPQSTNEWSIQFDNILASDGSTLFMFSNGDC